MLEADILSGEGGIVLEGNTPVALCPNFGAVVFEDEREFEFTGELDADVIADGHPLVNEAEILFSQVVSQLATIIS